MTFATLFAARSASMISRIKFELSLVRALELDMGWFCIEIESRDFTRSGTKAELIYSRLQLIAIGICIRMPGIRLRRVKTRHKISYNSLFFLPGAYHATF